MIKSGPQIYRHLESSGVLRIGTYLWPHTVFAPLEQLDPSRDLGELGARIVAHTQLDGWPVEVTAAGGLFTEPPPELHEISDDDLDTKIAAEREVAQAFNLFICELALCGQATEPASPAVIGVARADGNHIMLMGGGGRHQHRQMEMTTSLLGNGGISWMSGADNDRHLETVLRCARAPQLATISPTLPQLVAGAYWMHDIRAPSEALLDAFIVVEQLVNHWWQGHRAGATGARRDRLNDNRTSSVAVRIEVLQTDGYIDDDLADLLQQARKLRNDLAHGARISHTAALTGINAMTAALSSYLQEDLVAPVSGDGISW